MTFFLFDDMDSNEAVQQLEFSVFHRFHTVSTVKSIFNTENANPCIGHSFTQLFLVVITYEVPYFSERIFLHHTKKLSNILVYGISCLNI